MTAMNDSIVFACEGETAAKAVTAALTRRNFFVVRSFDLRSALAAREAAPWECECPHHGTTQCACQFVVLLVYGLAAEPVTLTAHSRDDRTQVRLVRDATTQPDPRLAAEVMAALCEECTQNMSARGQTNAVLETASVSQPDPPSAQEELL